MSAFDLDVLVVGSLHLDIIVNAKALPVLDETARGSSWRMACGGKGGNQACWAAKLGAKTAMISQVGDDDFGRRLLDSLKASGVDSVGVSTDPKTGSGMSVAILNQGGDYGAVIVSGSNLTLSENRLLQSMQRCGAPRWLVLQNEVEESINIAAARQVKAVGGRVILNAAPARDMPPSLAAMVDVLVVNRVEASMLSGHEVTTAETVAASLPRLCNFGRDIVVTLGGGGLVVAQLGQEPVIIAAIPTSVISTHGAGDCFVAQLAVSLAQNTNLIEAATTANKTAAAYVSGTLKV